MINERDNLIMFSLRITNNIPVFFLRDCHISPDTATGIVETFEKTVTSCL